MHFIAFVGCDHCKTAKPEFEQAAIQVQGEGNKVMAAVDCSVEAGLSCLSYTRYKQNKVYC